jgi:hypothetical protein
MLHADVVRLRLAHERRRLRRCLGRRAMVVIAIVRHRYFDVLLLGVVPEVEPDVLEPVDPVPLLELEPAPVSVETEPETLPEVLGVVEALVDVSLDVDGVVGEVVVVVVVEPGVELVPELLYEVLPLLASRWQPARPAVARARTAT